MSTSSNEQLLQDEIARLKTRLATTQAQLDSSPKPLSTTIPPTITTSTHTLLLLSDSALPLGSFAFSSGLESHLAHHPSRTPPPIHPFLSLALQTLATTTLPHLLSAYRHPSHLRELDDTLDASILCHVTRRASTAQGRALLTVWERAFSSTIVEVGDGDEGENECREILAAVGREVKGIVSTIQPPSSSSSHPYNAEDIQEPVKGHFAPIWGVVTRAMGIHVHESAYVYLLNHAKAVLSAGVRASVLGPYQAQAVLGSGWLRGEVERLVGENWEVEVEDAGQGVPAMDLWVGRHELLYSRIFNS
ncbi:MAG: hypothetical protein Q9178_000099 [Gyalolechia marmorata]